MTREEIIGKATRIAQLRDELARLAALQKELKFLESELDGIADSPSVVGGADPNSLLERLVALADSTPNREWTGEDAAQSLGAKLPSVRAAYSRAVSAGRIVKCGRGRFRSIKQATGPEAVQTNKEENLTAA